MQILPPIGVKGVWNLIPPFSTLIQAGKPYTLIAVRRLTDILAAGDDPEATYYTVNGVASAQYLKDLAANVAILSLQSSSSNVVYVPDTYVNGYPDIGGIPYRVLGLTVNLGAIPDTLSLANVISKVQDDVRELVGVTAKAKVMALSSVNLLSPTKAKAIEAARKANIGTTITDYTRYVQCSLELAAARQKIGLLEAFILANSAVLKNAIPISALTVDQVSNMTTSEAAALLPTVISMLNTDQLQALTPSSITALTTAQIQALTTAQVSELTTGQVSVLTTPQLQAFTTSDIAALTTQQIAALSPVQKGILNL